MVNPKDNKKNAKPVAKDTDNERFARYEKSAYFQKKDKKAAAFLKKHPIPENLLG